MYVATLSILKYKPVSGGYLIVLITAGSVFKYFRIEWLPVLVISKSLKELAISWENWWLWRQSFFLFFFQFFWELWLHIRICFFDSFENCDYECYELHWKRPGVFFSLVSDNHPTLVIMGMNMFDDFWGIAKENWLHIGWHLSKSPYLDLAILKALKNQESFSCFFSFSEINFSSCRNLPRKTLVVIIFEVWELVGGNTCFDQNQKNCHSRLTLKP